MPASEHDNLQKHTLNLYRGDMDKLRDYFPKAEPSRIIRELVRNLINETEGDTASAPDLGIQIVGVPK